MPTLGAQNYDQQIQLKFDGNCSFLSNSTQKAAFETTVREKCANATGRDPAMLDIAEFGCISGLRLPLMGVIFETALFHWPSFENSTLCIHTLVFLFRILYCNAYTWGTKLRSTDTVKI